MGSLFQNPRDIEPLISPMEAANAAPPLIAPAKIGEHLLQDREIYMNEQADEWAVDKKRGVFTSGPFKGQPIGAARNALNSEFKNGTQRPKPGTRSTIASQSPTMALNKNEWNETFKKPAPMNPAMSEAAAISNARQRQAGAVKDAAAVRAAVAPQPAAPMKVTDMRPANQRAAADGAPNGVAYLNQLSNVFAEQGMAEQAQQADPGADVDYGKRGGYYAKDEAARRTAQIANPSMTAPYPVNAKAAVLTDPKYGGSGVALATNGAAPSLRDAWAGSAGVRDINKQISRGLTPAPVVTPSLPAPQMKGPSPMNPALDSDEEPARKPAFNRSFVSK